MTPVARQLQKLSGAQLVDKYFVAQCASTSVCLLCYPEFSPDELNKDIKVLKKGKTGYTWARQHLQLKHPGYDNQSLTQQSLLISPAAEHTYKWIEWIVGENRELSFVEKERVRRYTVGNLRSISVKTLKERMEKTVEIMKLI